MAEGWSSSVLCRYYLNGCCRDGASCRFSHDRHSSQPNMICRYYLKGQCTYGDRCRYDHVRPSAATATAATGATGASVNVATSTVALTSASASASNLTISNKITDKHSTSPPAAPAAAAAASSSASSSSSSANSELNKLSSGISRGQIGHLTVLKKQSPTVTTTCNTDSKAAAPFPSLCAEAPEFVPSGPVCMASYAQVTGDRTEKSPEAKGEEKAVKESDILCPFAIMGECRFGDQCAYIHGEICEQCSHACLHPTDADQRRQHQADCLKAHERDMELSFAVARSKDKICTICMDVIMEKWPQHERRFGILPNCNHIFCLSCIRTWRSTKQLENKTVRSCPQCRTPSDFVTPSNFWCDNQSDKDRLIEAYKKALSLKPCKYFKQGNGECPFAGNCFYLHAYPDGQKATLPPPRPRRRRNADGDIELMQQIFLWDFMDERESRWLLQFDLDDMLDFFSDSDDSSDENYSDFDI